MGIAWKSVSKPVLALGLGAAALFWIHALTARGGFLVLDYVNLPIHEAGHLFFGVLGRGIGIWGGTLFQLLIPAVFVVYFALRGETSGTAFGVFWLGENGLYAATYIADARTMDLPLVGGGEHDWNKILSGLGLLRYDAGIARAVRLAGWVLMLAAVYFFYSKRERAAAAASSAVGKRPGGRGART